jgi:hypothetical protein
LKFSLFSPSDPPHRHTNYVIVCQKMAITFP